MRPFNIRERSVESMSGEEVCGICLESGKEEVVTGCGHVFCSSCITNLLENRGPSSFGGVGPPRCPMCRVRMDPFDLKYRTTGDEVMVRPNTSPPQKMVTASVGCVWRYGDQFVKGSGQYDSLVKESWLVLDVCHYHVGAEATLVPPGHYLAAFRVKRLKNLRFPNEVVLYLDGVEKRRVKVEEELDRVGVWELLIVGQVDVVLTRSVSASMRAFDEESKGGLVIDCLVLYPPQNTSPPSLILKPDDSRPWTILVDGSTRKRIVRLSRGKWCMDGGKTFRLRRTNPISFVWKKRNSRFTNNTIITSSVRSNSSNSDDDDSSSSEDFVIYALVDVVDNKLHWRSNYPEAHPDLFWLPRQVTIFSDLIPLRHVPDLRTMLLKAR